MKRSWSSSIAICLGLIVSAAHAQAPMVVHEWGTLTTQHAPDGTPQGYLNRIHASEVLPSFVHRFEPAQTRSNPFGKGPQTSGRPDVTMRLETPVIYFYGAAGSNARGFDVRVQLRGGILNEFYPNAEASVSRDSGRLQDKFAARVIAPTDPINLDNYLLGGLAWSNVVLDSTAPVPETGATVWIAPRNVAASRLRTSGEGEHYLFYRGVAHLDALLSTKHSPQRVRVSGPRNLSWLLDDRMTIARAWFADVRADGTLAFAMRADLVVEKANPGGVFFEVPRFKPEDYGESQAAALRLSMKQQLTAAGLFDDEAEAMLATWNDSYFRKPGPRIFYTVPRSWIDYFLPLELSIPHEATRVLIGRIDLVD